MYTVYLLKNPKPVNEQGTYLNPQAAGKSSRHRMAGMVILPALYFIL